MDFKTCSPLQREVRGGAPAKNQGHSKVFNSVDEAVADIKSGSTVLSAGFGLCGTPDTLIAAMHRRGAESLHSLVVVSNNAGTAAGGGLSPLISSGQVNKAICSFIGANKALEDQYLSGQISIELTPQGTLAEKLRCGGAGIPAFYTPTGVGTFIQSGQIPLKVRKGDTLEPGLPRETRIFDGRVYNMETAIKGDVCHPSSVESRRGRQRQVSLHDEIVLANDGQGRKKSPFIEAEHIVKVGEIKPDEVDVPSVYVDRIVQASADKQN